MITSNFQAIKLRTSVRSYATADLPPEVLARLASLASPEQRGPFGSAVRFHLIALSEVEKTELRTLGTYGVVSGAGHYLAGVVADGPRAMEDFGFCMEELIIGATKLGLGTCWLGGSFNRSGFARKLGLAEGQLLPCVTPLGVPAARRTLVDSAMRLMAGSRNRKPWAELFFDGGPGLPLAEDPGDPWHQALACVRLGPSASNKQPWRMVREGGSWHLYLYRTKGYPRLGPGIDLQRVDMGIAMCHFSLAASELGLAGQWRQAGPDITAGEWNYVASWS